MRFRAVCRSCEFSGKWLKLSEFFVQTASLSIIPQITTAPCQQSCSNCVLLAGKWPKKRYPQLLGWWRCKPLYPAKWAPSPQSSQSKYLVRLRSNVHIPICVSEKKAIRHNSLFNISKMEKFQVYSNLEEKYKTINFHIFSLDIKHMLMHALINTFQIYPINLLWDIYCIWTIYPEICSYFRFKFT